MSNPASGTNIPELDITPTVIVSDPNNPPPVTSVITMVDASAGGGIVMPQRTEAWSFVAADPPGWDLDGRGLREPDTIRLISLGPADVTIVPYEGDDPPAVTVLKAFQCIDITPQGACIRIW